MTGASQQLLVHPIDPQTFWMVSLLGALLLQGGGCLVVQSYYSNGEAIGKFLYRLYKGSIWATSTSVVILITGALKDFPLDIPKILPQPEVLGWIILFWTVPLVSAASSLFWDAFRLRSSSPPRSKSRSPSRSPRKVKHPSASQ
jgi:hypothetical protein